MRCPFAILLAASTAAACVTSDPSETLRVDGLTPAISLRGADTEVEIDGYFPVGVTTSYRGSNATRVVTEHQLWLGERPLLEIEWVTADKLVAAVPSDLPLGVYDLKVEGPGGTATLSDAFTVWSVEQGCSSRGGDRYNAFGGSGGATNSGLTAPVVLFQDDFGANLENRDGGLTPTAVGVARPYSLGGYVDPCAEDAVRFLVVDRGNNRVLLFDEVPHSADVSPDIVLGQTSFDAGEANAGGPVGAVGFDDPVHASICSDGKLFVADRGNNRVLGWFRPPTESGQPADFVLGQADFVSNANGVGPDRFNDPYAAHCIGTQLFVVDKENNRVLIYDDIPRESGASASIAVGQPTLTDNTLRCTANGLSLPYELLVAGDRLYVADGGNHRVLEFDGIPSADGASATAVIGQGDFVSCQENRGNANPSEDTLRWPNALAVDGETLAVCDHSNNRIVLHDLPFTTGQAAFAQLGQPDFLTATLVDPPVQGSVSRCKGLLFDGDYLWTAESGNRRVQAIPLQ